MLGLFKTAKIKSVPIWMISLILIGTAAGSLVWISNEISDNVLPVERPIELEGQFITTPFLDEPAVQTFSYTINDNTQDVGYIVLDFWTSGGVYYLYPANLTILVTVDVGSDDVGTDLVTGYPVALSPYYLRYVFENYETGPIDFGNGDSETLGLIDVGITYHVLYSISVSIQISSTVS